MFVFKTRLQAASNDIEVLFPQDHVRTASGDEGNVKGRRRKEE